MATKESIPAVLTCSQKWRKFSESERISAYEAIERGDVPSIRIGRRILIPRHALEQLLGRVSVPKPEV